MGVSRKNLLGHGISRVLAIDLSMIGDLVMLSPALRTLRETYEEAYLALLAQPFAKELYRGGLVDEVIPYDKKGKDKGIRGLLRIAKEVRKRRFDAAFIFHKSFGSALIAYLAKIKIRVGYATEMRSRLLTHKVELPTLPTHIVYENLNLLQSVGIQSKSEKLEIHPDFTREESFLRWAIPQLKSNGDKPIIAVCPHGGWETKNWSSAYINRFLDLFPVNSAIFVLVGSPGEEKYAERIYSVTNNLINLVGKTTIRELCYVLKLADVLVSPDTSAVHIAQALGTPVVALFGPTPPERCGPISTSLSTVISGNVNCLKCYLKKCSRQPFCMDTILPEKVKEAVDFYLLKSRPNIIQKQPLPEVLMSFN